MTTGVLTMAHTGTTPTLAGLVSQSPNLQLLLKSRGHRVYRCLCHRVSRGLVSELVFTSLNKHFDIFPPNLCLICFTALDARLEVGLEQQAELMLKMMATLQADSILQALTSSSSSGNHTTPKKVNWRQSILFLVSAAVRVCISSLHISCCKSCCLAFSEPGLQRDR